MYMEEMTRFQVGEDSPVFSNMFKYCQVTPPPQLQHHLLQVEGLAGT